MARRIPHGYRFGEAAKRKQELEIPPTPIGHSCPQRYPQSKALKSIGEPLSISEAASLIGCSPWTVRHTLIPMGLPFLRFGASGKLIFYRDQVVRWIQSREGGTV